MISGYLSFSLLQAVEAGASWRDLSCAISSARHPGRAAKAMSTYLSTIFALARFGIEIGASKAAGNGQVFIVRPSRKQIHMETSALAVGRFPVMAGHYPKRFRRR